MTFSKLNYGVAEIPCLGFKFPELGFEAWASDLALLLSSMNSK